MRCLSWVWWGALIVLWWNRIALLYRYHLMLVTPLGKSAVISISLWRHNESDSVLNHQPDDCLPKRVFTSRSMDTSKPLVTGLCEGNSLVTDEFPAQMASKAENVSTWWRHHVWFHFPEVDKEHGWCITSMHEIVTHRKLRKLLAFEKKRKINWYSRIEIQSGHWNLI